MWEEGVPALAELFRSLGVPAAFYVVGRDLGLASKAEAARALWAQGFEAGNHSNTHRIGLTELPVGAILEDMRAADNAIRATGAKPVGFRSPGYDIDARLLQCVRRMGYLYDASLLPSPWAPVLRMVSRAMALRWNTPPRQFGRLSLMKAPMVPYFSDPQSVRRAAQSFADGRLLEIPVGVTRARLPLTAGALLGASRAAMRDAFAFHAEARRDVLFLLHGIDAVDCRRPIVFDHYRPSPGGFRMSAEKKLRRLRAMLETALATHEPVLAADFARERCR